MDHNRNWREIFKKINLDYPHGTGHVVGYYLNVHKGPQAISKNNNVSLKEGMVISNEPGFYKKVDLNKTENLIWIKKLIRNFYLII